MSKLIARIAAVCSLVAFFTLIRSPKFWEMCEQRAQKKFQWREELLGEECYIREPDYYDVIWEAWYEVHNKFGLRYKDKAELYDLLSNYYK